MKQHQIFGIVNLANIIFPTIVERYGNGEKGGYLCISSYKDMPECIYKMGDPEFEKRDKYIEFCQEKANRVLANICKNHILSSQSRNPEENKWGGAIYTKDSHIVLSFSGLPEAVDEMFVAELAYRNSPRLISHDNYVEARNLSLRPEIWY